MKILVVDDDFESRDAVFTFLQNVLDHDVTLASSCQDAMEIYSETFFDVVISDIKMKGASGIDLLKFIKKQDVGTKTDVVLMTGFGELETSIEALRAGASDYILKPVHVKQLNELLKKISHSRTVSGSENQPPEEDVSNFARAEMDSAIQIEGVGPIGVFSERSGKIFDLALKLHEERGIPALIEGETGTGKEIIARLIHNAGRENDRAFVSINCSAISPSLFESELFGYEKGAFTGAKSEGSPGKLELAQNGTIFLDEIGDMPLDLQPKLLRAIQQKEIFRIGGTSPIALDLRFIAATNQSLKAKMEAKEFRSDLFYRLHTGYIHLPALRERRSEIAALARMFMLDFAELRGKKFKYISRDAIFHLEEYAWPGNIRELKNIIERICFLYDEEIIRKEHLNFLNASPTKDDENKLIIDLSADTLPLEEVKKQLAMRVYKKFGGNISKSAKYLDVAWATFVNIAGLKKNELQ